MDDLEQIKQLKARYFRALDTQDWNLLRGVLARDAVVDMTEASGGPEADGVRHDGVEAFITSLESDLAGAVTVHHGHMPEIELTSPSTASGIWSMNDLLRWPDGTEIVGYGHYHERYDKVDGRWMISRLKLTRLLVDTSRSTRPN